MMPRKVFLLGEYDSEDRYVSPPFMEWLKNDREVVETLALLLWGGVGARFFCLVGPFHMWATNCRLLPGRYSIPIAAVIIISPQ